jgi:hypothetical protein
MLLSHVSTSLGLLSVSKLSPFVVSGAELQIGTTTKDQTKGHCSSHKCTMYLAESSIPNAGFGMFTGIDRDKGSAMAGPDIVHHLVDHSLPSGSYMSDLHWSSSVSGGFYEAEHVSSLIPGVGSIGNGFYSLLNAEAFMGAPSTGAAEISDVSRGAYSTYMDHFFIATRSVRAGEEVFLDYGENYFLDRASLATVPLHRDFVWAREKVNEVRASFNYQDISQEDWDAIRTEIAQDARERNALPSKASELSEVALSEAPWYFLPNNPRTGNWLDENGFCLDFLERRVSPIPHAGHGAFSKTLLPKGKIVVPVPLAHLRRSDLHVRLDADGQGIPSHKRNPHQQILNYCFGHAESSMLLYPYSHPSHSINHNGADPNAKLVWSPTASYHSSDWFNKSTEDILTIDHPGLMMHIVAIRDILPDEEVTLDYGHDWERAWQDHVARVNVEGNSSHVSAAEMNFKQAVPRTIFEQVNDPYPDNIATVCHYHFEKTDHGNESKYPSFYADGVKQSSDQFNSLHRAVLSNAKELQQMEDILDDIIKAAPSWEDSDLSGRYLRPCKIIGREPDDQGYVVRMFNRDNMEEDEKIEFTREHYARHVPRSAIVFIDKPYTSHVHHINAFRHEIGIPDDIFPTAWKDLARVDHV